MSEHKTSVMRKEENQNIEFKEQWRDDILKTVCAFANTGGGMIYIGLDDNGRSVVLKDARKLLTDIPNKTRDILGIVADVKIIKKAGRPVIKVTVKKSTAPISYHGVFYVRSGSTTSELNGNELSRFLLSRAGASWDGIVEARASFDDISAKAVRNFQQLAKKRFPFIAKEKSVRMVLKKLNLVEKGKLKRAAVLLFGKDPRKYFTSAFIQVGRFVSESEVISTDVIEGNLFEQVEKTIEVLRLKYLENRFYYEGLLRKEDMIYPEEALREAVVNAVIHRDYLGPHTQLRVYDRKLWLWNAGELPEKITFEKLKIPHLSCPRNELLADVFFKAGYIEAWGRGTIKIVDACRKTNLPDPEFSELTSGFLVSFVKGAVETAQETPRRGTRKNSQKGGVEKGAERGVESTEKVRRECGVNAEKVLSVIAKNLFIKTHEIAEKTQLAQRTVENAIACLKREGFLNRIGPDKGGYWEIVE